MSEQEIKKCACGTEIKTTWCAHKIECTHCHCDHKLIHHNGQVLKGNDMYHNGKLLEEHGRWYYDCSAWSTIQEKNHGGVSGIRKYNKESDSQKDVEAFILLHGKEAYCRITAQRLTTSGSTVQYFTCYIHCIGCGVVNQHFRVPPTDCFI